MEPERYKTMGVDTSAWWAQQTVLVTGCTGFLGCWVSLGLCQAGARVIGLSRQQPTAHSVFHLFGLRDHVTLVSGSIEEEDALSRTMTNYTPDIVFHLAGQSQVGLARRDPHQAFEVNIRGTWNLLDACRTAQYPPRVILASSGALYGNPGQSPVTEVTPLIDTSPYGASKICAELLGQVYARTYDLKCGILRYSNLYGGGDTNLNRIIPSTISAALRGEPPVIRGNGRAARDYLYIGDAIRAGLMLAQQLGETVATGEVFNICSEQFISVRELVDLTLKCMGRGDLKPQVLNQTTGDVPFPMLSAQKARQRLGWSAQVSLETGLASTIVWYQRYQHLVLPQ